MNLQEIEQNFLIGLGEEQENTRFDRGHFKEYGPHSLNFEIVYFYTSRNYHLYLDTLQEVNLRIFELFEKEKIEFAYPTQTIFFDGTSNMRKDN